MASTQPEKKTLFNDPILSDIKILQVFNGETKEYYAHKQILINQSEYFLKAFTGDFKEATENTMTLEDDDPIYFEMMLKFIYTTSLHVPKTSTLTNDDPRKTVDLLLGIYKVADKYAVTDMLLVISNKLSDALQGFSWLCGVPRYQKFEEIIEAYYQDCPSSNTLPGLAIAHATLKYAFWNRDYGTFPELLRKYPDFAVDIALDQMKQRTLGLFEKVCSNCKQDRCLMGSYAMEAYCSACDEDYRRFDFCEDL